MSQEEPQGDCIAILKMMSITIDVAKEFSPLPFGRYPTDGQNSGTRFREEVLKRALLHNGEVILIDFTNVRIGIGSSFLEESFGGLVRAGFDAEDLKDRINVTGGLAFYPSQVIRFIDRANHVIASGKSRHSELYHQFCTRYPPIHESYLQRATAWVCRIVRSLR